MYFNANYIILGRLWQSPNLGTPQNTPLPYFGNKGQLEKLRTMVEKTILTADLYDNVLTDKVGDYTAKPQITGTVRNADLADRIVMKRTEFRPETIITILKMADDEKIGAISEGKSVIDGVGQYLLNMNGCFEGEKPVFDPKIHKVGITFTPGKKLLDSVGDITFNLQTATVGSVINSITDKTTGSISQKLTPGGPAIITGSNIMIKGDSPDNGFFFTKDETGAPPQKVMMIVTSVFSQTVITIPMLTAGQYRLSITTQAGSNYKQVKGPRTYIFPVLLTVGGSSGENPDENPDIL